MLTQLNPPANTETALIVTELGLEITSRVTAQEWRAAGESISRGMRSVAFVVGDWLVAGEAVEDLFGHEYRDPKDLPEAVLGEAARLTGLDVATLTRYAAVARALPMHLRRNLSWEHHRAVASLKDVEAKREWLDLAEAEAVAGRPISARRLARSVSAGRLLGLEEMLSGERDRGEASIASDVQSIVAKFARLEAQGRIAGASRDEIALLAEDLRPVAELHARLVRAAA
jgi:hypothetical protein